MQIVENIKLTSNYATVFDTALDGSPLVRGESSAVNFSDTFHDCKMKPSAVKQIKKAANVIVAISKKQHFTKNLSKVGCTSYRRNDVWYDAAKTARNSHLATFVTLTLPAKQTHTDTEITAHCLNPFFAYARKMWNVKYFIWKKELQGNGNLHFHIMCDKYIQHEALRREWNKLINKGYSGDCRVPFDYVDRYHNKWTAFYANGFDRDAVADYVSKLPSVIDEINRTADGNVIESYTSIEQRIINREIDRYRRIYDAEMKIEDSAQRFANPNSTDIQAVKSTALVSAYLAKYMAKDVDDTPELKQYWQTVEYCKDQIYITLRTIQERNNDGLDCSNENEYFTEMKEYLRQYRAEHCPILGNLWYKSASLTPYMYGVTDILHTKLFAEVKALTDYLQTIETDRNNKRRKQGKKPVALIRKVYAKKEDGTDDLDKCICVTLLVTCFELNTWKDKKGKLKFPLLSRLWSGYFNTCQNYNTKRDVYYTIRRTLKHDATLLKSLTNDNKCFQCPFKQMVVENLQKKTDRYTVQLPELAAELAAYRAVKFQHDPRKAKADTAQNTESYQQTKIF